MVTMSAGWKEESSDKYNEAALAMGEEKTVIAQGVRGDRHHRRTSRNEPQRYGCERHVDPTKPLPQDATPLTLILPRSPVVHLSKCFQKCGHIFKNLKMLSGLSTSTTYKNSSLELIFYSCSYRVLT